MSKSRKPRKVQTRFNKDGSVTLYNAGRKIWRGSYSNSKLFLQGWGES